MTTPINDVVGIQTRTSLHNSALLHQLAELNGMSFSGVGRLVIEDEIETHYEHTHDPT